jgi:hypothetical protein
MTQLHTEALLPLVERLEAKLHTQQQEMDKLREENVQARIKVAVQAAVQAAQKPQEAVSDEQLAALQTRIESLHEAKLLSEDEFYSLEDLCAE